MKAAIGIKVQQGKYRHDFNRQTAELIDGKYQIDGDPKTLSSDEYNDWADWFNKEKPNKPVNLAASHNLEGERLEEKQSVFDGGSVGRSMGDWIDWSVRRK